MPKSIRKIFEYPSVVSLILFILFLCVTNYKFGWDDQHLEIPLLKSLIDPTLYVGDYYVQSLKQHFSSYFYLILSKFISIEQIPQTYFFLWLLSRYFLFYWIYKLWLHVSQSRLKAFSAVLVFILVSRVQEFLYRTFSHQEFALAFIFAGIYFFFVNRIILAAIILGLATNIHALYSVFPMFCIVVYLLWDFKKVGFKTIFFAISSYLLCSLPFLVWTFKTRVMESSHFDIKSYPDWINLFYLACPQNFFFAQYSSLPWKTFTQNPRLLFEATQSYLFLIVLFILNLIFNEFFRRTKKAVLFSVGGFILLILCLVFTYIYPHPFFIDLNLERNTQFLLFILMGFTTIMLMKDMEEGDTLNAFMLAVFFAFFKYAESIGIVSILMILVWFWWNKTKDSKHPGKFFLIFLLFLGGGLIFKIFSMISYQPFVYRNLALLGFSLILFYFILKLKGLKNLYQWFILIPLTVFFLQYAGYYQSKLKDEQAGQGFWRLQRSWEDMQRFVKASTPKDALILIPYNMEMGGFRIFSERKVLVCYRDCGIIGFDFQAAVEWNKRIKDIQAFKVNINAPLRDAVANAILKYHANYIVFLKVAAPKDTTSVLEKLYSNNDFVLFSVKTQGI
jgi:hypothetical protein